MKRITYDVDGETVRADLHEPPGVRKAAIPLIVAVHGLGSSRVEWADFPQRLAEAGFAVMAIDFRGHGESTGPRGIQSIERATADIRGAIEQAKQEFRIDTGRVALVGHSLGAALALHAAAAFDLRCLVLLAPPDRLKDETNFFELQGYRAARGVNALLRPFIKKGISVPYKVDYARLYESKESVARANQLRFLQGTIPVANYKTLMLGVHASAAARATHVPSLVIVADKDQVVKNASSRRVYEALAGPKEWAVIAGSGHSMPGDLHAETLLQHVTKFLRAHLGSEAR